MQNSGADARMAKTIIIGGGVAGLVAAYDLAKRGDRVVVCESHSEPGGLAASFTLAPGLRIENYYHFICRGDRDYLALLDELGLASSVKWRSTRMGLFYRGRCHSIGDPLHLLRFPHFSLTDKIRFFAATAANVFAPSEGWRRLAQTPVAAWLMTTYGRRAYEVLYEPLLRLKFRQYANEISAAWMWARFHRLGRSRNLVGRECLGHIVGGTDRFLNALLARLRELNVEIRLNEPVSRVEIENNAVRRVIAKRGEETADRVLSTAPIPRLLKFLPQLSAPYFENLRALKYIGVNVMFLQLRRSLSPYFWLNISDPDMELAGIIEYTNLNPGAAPEGSALLYLPQYLPTDHPLYDAAPERLFDLYAGYMKSINPQFDRSWVMSYTVHRDPFAQPICGVDFVSRIPDMTTPVKGLYITDSYQIHPGDRTISDSIALGHRAARVMSATP
jgi:protoporphyrinogen oxidase